MSFVVTLPFLGQQNLLPLAGWEMSANQSAMKPGGWQIKKVVSHSACGLNLWMAGKTW